MVKRENLVKVSEDSLKHYNNYIGEIKLVDKTNDKEYFVVCRLGDLFYKTFETSFIDYVKGVSKTEPVKVEGEKYMFFDYGGEHEMVGCDFYTPFRPYYEEALSLAGKIESDEYNKRKYAHMKKPSGTIKYTILDSDDEVMLACGPIGDRWQLHFYLEDEKREVYVLYEWAESDIYTLADFNLMEAPEDMDIESKAIEVIWSRNKIKKSKYYDLYYAMEQFRDGIIKVPRVEK